MIIQEVKALGILLDLAKNAPSDIITIGAVQVRYFSITDQYIVQILNNDGSTNVCELPALNTTKWSWFPHARINHRIGDEHITVFKFFQNVQRLLDGCIAYISSEHDDEDVVLVRTRFYRLRYSDLSLDSIYNPSMLYNLRSITYDYEVNLKEDKSDSNPKITQLSL